MIVKIKNNFFINIVKVWRDNNISYIETNGDHSFKEGDVLTVSCDDSSYDVSEVLITSVPSGNTLSYNNEGLNELQKSITGYAGVNITLEGMIINPNTYYTLEPEEIKSWSNSSRVLLFIANSTVIVNNGSYDIGDVNKAINYIKGNLEVRPMDGKLFITESARPSGSMIYFTGCGDDISDPTKVGFGDPIKIHHKIGDPVQQIIDVKYNIKENRTFIHEGYINWSGADFDEICLALVPEATVVSPGLNTNFRQHGPLIIPADNDGDITINPEDINLVEMPHGMDYNVRPAAFWNAEYDIATHTFSNITPAPMGDGLYNIFSSSIVLANFVHKVTLVDKGFQKLQSGEAYELGHNMNLRFVLNTEGEDHEWKASITLTLYRFKVGDL